MLTATRPQTITILGWAALLSYVVAVLLFLLGSWWDDDTLRDLGLAVGLLGLGLDMRHHTARGVSRLVQTMALWDYDDDPQHRRDLPHP